jgi:uracil-DNA glycosylase
MASDRAGRGKGPRQRQLTAARDEAATCRRCDLWRLGTQTVFGAGAVDAELMLVGEQPGDQEDRAGVPFVGPAGKILEKALERAGLGDVRRYVTNAVKHFKHEPRGKRRIHKKPNNAEMMACQFWLEQEIAAVAPRTVVALGATAARSLLGRTVPVLAERGRWLQTPGGGEVLVTVHPSSILRAPDDRSRTAAMEAFVADLREVAKKLNPRASVPHRKSPDAR